MLSVQFTRIDIVVIIIIDIFKVLILFVVFVFDFIFTDTGAALGTRAGREVIRVLVAAVVNPDAVDLLALLVLVTPEVIVLRFLR